MVARFRSALSENIFYKFGLNENRCRLISVVIPLHNKANHIANTLESVLAQKLKPLEIIVIDDGSTDDGAEIVRRFANAGVKLICQRNQGASAARNRGLKEVASEYVAFLDADDYWLPEHLEELSKLAQSWPNAVLLSTSHVIRREGKIFSPRSAVPPGWEGVLENFFRSFSLGLSLVNSSTACVKRSVAIAVGGFPVGVSRGEDVIAWTRLALIGPVAHRAVETAVYNQEAENRSTEVQAQDPPGSLVYLSKLLQDHGPTWEAQEGVAALFDRMALVTAAGFRLNGDFYGASQIARLATETGRFRVAALIRLVVLTPLVVLRLAKRLRHKQVE